MPMAMSHRTSQTHRPRPGRVSLAGLFIGLVRSLAGLGRELQARRAIAYLRSLDDQRLLDLGVKREDIEHFVRSGRND
jgi:uncharacterized protein YjiS (DUF1127 family)